MSTPQQHQKESSVQEAHHSKTPLLTPKIRNEIDPRKDGNIEFDSYEDLFKALQKLGACYGHSLIIRQSKKRKKSSTILIDCDEGRLNKALKNIEIHPSRKRPKTGNFRTDCEFRINAKEHPTGKLTVIYKEANQNDLTMIAKTQCQ